MLTPVLLGTTFIIVGVCIYYIGKKRGVFNTEMWALFPVLHGLHEFTRHFTEHNKASTIIEQLEVGLAIAYSTVLFAASIELLGVVPKPYGKLIALSSNLTAMYFVVSSPHVFKSLRKTEVQIFTLTTTYFQQLYTIYMVMLSVASIIISYYYLMQRSRQNGNGAEKAVTKLTVGTIVLLISFAIIEAFSASNTTLGSIFRGVTVVLFALIPSYAIIASKAGLQKLVITLSNGNFVGGFDFNRQVLTRDRESALEGMFISALTTFLKMEVEFGTVSEIVTSEGVILIATTNQFLITLLTWTFSNKLRQRLLEFSLQLEKLKISTGIKIEYDVDEITSLVNQHFKEFL